MDARLSLLLAWALLGACGRTDVDPSDTPQGQQLAQHQQPAQEEQPAQEQPPAPRAGGPDTAESEPAEPAPTTPEPATAAQEPMFSPTPATVVRETELKAQPLLDTETLATLPERTDLIIVDRRGGWFEVVHEETRGWVRLLHVSSQPPGPNGAIPPELERAARVATGRAGEGNIVVTTGTRGLTEEELRQAEANPEEVRRMEALAADPAQAETYAREHGLERQSVPYAPDPRGGDR